MNSSLDAVGGHRNPGPLLAIFSLLNVLIYHSPYEEAFPLVSVPRETEVHSILSRYCLGPEYYVEISKCRCSDDRRPECRASYQGSFLPSCQLLLGLSKQNKASCVPSPESESNHSYIQTYTHYSITIVFQKTLEVLAHTCHRPATLAFRCRTQPKQQ